MSIIKHSKYRNSGILFELLVRQTTADLLQGSDSKAAKILKKYYTNTELGKEYTLYNTAISSKKLSESKADLLISTILEQHKKLDREKIERLKYNLIREIKTNYDIDDFFKAKINNYKEHASIYTLFESLYANKTDVKQVFNNKICLLEHITQESVSDKSSPKSIIDDLLKEDKEIRLIAYKILIEKFNNKYKSLTERQKSVLKTYINTVTDTTSLAKSLNEELSYIKKTLSSLAESTEDGVVKIKVKEVVSNIKMLKENSTIGDDNISSILQYLDLIKELEQVQQ